MSVPTFVVGTGRCGSTMLSSMLREHPKVLSLSEFFAQVGDGAGEAFTADTIDGSQFWATLSAVGPSNSFCLRRGVVFPEWLYPWDNPLARFSAETGVPAILLTALPHLTADHEALFDDLGLEVSTWPRSSIGEHYRRLFARLATRFDKTLWVERSGSFFLWAEPLVAMFPDARFIHIVRDGRDAALSMQQHPGFRFFFVMISLARVLGAHPIYSQDRSQADLLPAELRPFLPERFDAEAFRALDIPASVCAAFWAQQIQAGLSLLRKLPEERLLTLRYEDLLSDPERQLDVFASFLGAEFADAEWRTRCAAKVRKPRSTWRDLPETDGQALTEACREGFDLLRAAGVAYEL